MRWGSCASVEGRVDAAIREAAAVLRAQLDDAEPDLVIIFASEHHRPLADQVPELAAAAFGSALLIGCSAGGVIGGGQEIEQRPGLSVTAAVLPGVQQFPFHLEAGAVPRADRPVVWEELLGVPQSSAPHFLLLADPFSFDPEPLLRGLDRTYPTSRCVGGLASGAREAGANALFLGQQVYRSGLVGLALTGDIEVDAIVAQGCRPIGQPMFVTKCQDNLLWELDGQPAVEVLQALYESLEHDDQQLARHSLFLGIVMNEQQQEYRQGDFLIRNIAGMDPKRGLLAVGASLREKAVVQFHLRDGKTSAADLEQLLTHYQAAAGSARPQGALLFSCLGRGAGLYGHAGHDSDAFRRHLGPIPLGGFFCNGEIGPVHGATFLHGYTSAFGIFRSRGGN